jgi:hypothetical protein
MSNDLYVRDILEWSERQAGLLGRVAGDERHGDVDWRRVIDEITAVGVAQLNDVRGLLRQAMTCIIRIHLNWHDAARPDWELELGCLLDDAADQFTPSMEQRIDLDTMWSRTRARAIRPLPDDPRGHALPDHCPWTIDVLLANERDGLLSALAGWPVAPTTPRLQP